MMNEYRNFTIVSRSLLQYAVHSGQEVGEQTSFEAFSEIFVPFSFIINFI